MRASGRSRGRRRVAGPLVPFVVAVLIAACWPGAASAQSPALGGPVPVLKPAFAPSAAAGAAGATAATGTPGRQDLARVRIPGPMPQLKPALTPAAAPPVLPPDELEALEAEAAAVVALATGSGEVTAVEPGPMRATTAPSVAQSQSAPLVAQAQSAPRRLVPPAGAERPVRLQGGEVIVPVNKSQVLNVDRNFDEVSVGNQEIADVVPLTQNSVYIFGKQLGSTNLTFIGADGEVIAVVDLIVSHDVESLKSRLFELVPATSIEVRAAGDRVVVSGQVGSAGELARVLAVAESFAPDKVTNLLSVGGSQQVLLGVRFAEVERSAVKQLGLNSAFFEGGSAQFDFRSGDGVSLDPPSFATGVLTLLKGDYNLQLAFDVLEEKGVVRTLAEPNLIALSGDTASFLAGGEFPIPVGRDEDDEGIEVLIEFKQFGVSLAFTPTVIGGDLVNLVVSAEVSSIDPNVSIILEDLQIPGLAVRRARTTVELRDGQSFAIAGLLQDDFEDAVRQIPILGDIPVLGALFRSTRYQRGQTELVVVITPHLVEPVPAGTLLTPADSFVPPSEAELFLFGRIEGEGAPVRTISPAAALVGTAGGIDGPYGYILR